MVRKVFSIVLQSPNEEVARRIVETYPIHFKYTDTFYLVAVEQTVVSNEIAEAVGIKGDDRIEESAGVVFRMNSFYSGYAQKDLWEWLSSFEEN